MEFDETIVRCSAPSLCGIKPASLFSMDGECFDSGKLKLREWRGIFAKSRRYFVPLRKSENRVLFFVFDRNLLERILDSNTNVEYLKSKNFPVEKGFSAVLAELLHRLVFSAEFPHEVGLFLGYPLEDVLGFEKNSANYKYSGVWKVYGNPEKSKIQMKRYRRCTEKCMKLLEDGASLPNSIKIKF